MDDGKVVFFCGAGISRHTGLADFAQLTCNAFKACGLPLKKRGKDFPEDIAFRNGQYDRALHLLENQSRYMRHAVQQQLSKRPTQGSLTTHKAILDLSHAPDGGHRVVTTNFDDRFERAKPGLKWQAAPALEPPRGDDWSTLTYLHGRIDRKHDPEGRRLILTSADFARAYLQDGWAARFTQYLFEHYTIVFVGYSLADPVVGYLIDGVAADLKAHGRKLDAYIFADHDGSDLDQKRKQAVWESRGLKPLCFDRRDNFQRLHETLQRWAESHAKGINGRIQFALDLGRQPCDATRHSEEDVRLLAWALSKPDGSVARAFAEADPPPHISWLAPLAKPQIPTAVGLASLFGMPAQPSYGQIFIPGRLTGTEIMPNLHPVTGIMGRWLARHLKTKELIDWVIANDGMIHHTFTHFIRGEIPNIAEPWRRFWQLVADGCTRGHNIDFPVWPRTGVGWSDGMDAALLKAAKFRLKPQTSWLSILGDNRPIETLSQIARFDLEVHSADFLGHIWEHRTDAAISHALARHADSLTSLLAEGWTMLQRGNEWCDHKAALHEPDCSTPFTSVTALCLFTHSVLRQSAPGKAEALIRRWMSLGRDDGLSIFRRMTLLALIDTDDVDAAAHIDFLLTDKANVLWQGDWYPSGVDRLPGRVSFGEADRLIGVEVGGSVHGFIYGQKLDRAAAEPFLA
ncbi:SIR2 family protein [Magnetospirillum gryphiswaldense]|uniref:SIR2 family protein n=1 Tax=Magnetospirillum gryphiswaldense TaxID=55518 RepID=UPI001319C3B3|nr:SIR2 family protein [Magnetospirillum gryphiswaldense]